jgi:hypothetical protein
MPLIHPGEYLKVELIDANSFTITEVAAMLKYRGRGYRILSIKKQMLALKWLYVLQLYLEGLPIFGFDYRQNTILKKLQKK